MKTTGVLLEAFAALISRFSRSEIEAMPNSSRFGKHVLIKIWDLTNHEV